MTETTQNVAEEVQESEKSNSKVSLPVYFGVKAGMTRIFNDEGKHVPVTVIKLIPNVISQVKTSEKDGYEAYQVAFQEKRAKLVNKPKTGHLKKAGVEASFNRFAEIKADVSQDNLGKEVSLEAFPAKTYVDVTGTSKGKGFQGVIKRYGFSGGPATHGSGFHRRPGSMGNCTFPGRIMKGKKMPGQYGNKNITVRGVEVVGINKDENIVLLKGAVPGPVNGLVQIAVKG